MAKLYPKSTASLHFTKHKSGARGLQKHNERQPGQKHSNENINDERTKDNIILVGNDDRTYSERIKNILDKNYTGKKAIRKDAVRMVGTTVQIGGGISERATETEQVEFLKTAFEWLKHEYGEENIVSAVIHLDETTPHLHFDFVPLKNGKLSAKDVIGDKIKLKKTQEKFLNDMQELEPSYRFDRKLDNTFNGLEQKLFERLTKEQKEREQELEELEATLDDREVALDEREAELEKKRCELQCRAVENGKKLENIVKRSEMLCNMEKQLENKKQILNAQVKDFNEKTEAYTSRFKAREDVLRQREAEILQKDSEASERLIEANNEASRIKAKIFKLLEKMPLFNSRLIKWAEKQPLEERSTTEKTLEAIYTEGVERPLKTAINGSEEDLDFLESVTEMENDHLNKAKSLVNDSRELTKEDIQDFIESVWEDYDSSNAIQL